MEIKLSKREKILVLTVMILALVYTYHQYFLSPLLMEIDLIGKEVKENEERLGDLEGTDNGIDSLLTEIEAIKTRINELGVQVPDSPATPGIVARMEAFSGAAGVKLLSVDLDTGFLLGQGAEDTLKERDYLEIPVRVFISGTYENILDFLAALEGSERLYNITAFDLFAVQPGDSSVLDMRIDLCAYALLPKGQEAREPVKHDFVEQEHGRGNPFRPVEY